MLRKIERKKEKGSEFIVTYGNWLLRCMHIRQRHQYTTYGHSTTNRFLCMFAKQLPLQLQGELAMKIANLDPPNTFSFALMLHFVRFRQVLVSSGASALVKAWKVMWDFYIHTRRLNVQPCATLVLSITPNVIRLALQPVRSAMQTIIPLYHVITTDIRPCRTNSNNTTNTALQSGNVASFTYCQCEIYLVNALISLLWI